MRRYCLAAFCGLSLVIASFCGAVHLAAGGEADSQLKALRGKREALTAQIAARQASLAEADPAGETSAAANDDTLSHWRALDAVYVRQQTLLEQRGELEAQSKQAEKDLARLDDFKPDEPKPYSFL